MKETKPTLLCVEDSPPIMRVLIRTLEKSFKVLTSSTEEEAIQILAKDNVDIILADWQLETTTSKKVYELSKDLRVPFVFHSSSDPSEMPGGVLILQKPCSSRKMEETLFYELDKSKSLVVLSDPEGCPSCDGKMEPNEWPPDAVYTCDCCGYREIR